MKRIILGLAAAVGLCLTGGKASADPGGFVPPGGGAAGNSLSMSQIAGPNTLLGCGDAPLGRAPDRYGLHPSLKKLFHIPTANIGPGGGANWAAAGYGAGGPAFNPMGYPPAGCGPGGCPPGYGMGPGAYPPPMQGTLVFPYNNFTRSPRDYFMVDVNK